MAELDRLASATTREALCRQLEPAADKLAELFDALLPIAAEIESIVMSHGETTHEASLLAARLNEPVGFIGGNGRQHIGTLDSRKTAARALALALRERLARKGLNPAINAWLTVAAPRDMLNPDWF